MTRWFGSLPIHRKLVVMALAVSTAALGAAMIGLVAFDVVRFRASAVNDAHAFAQVIAENTAAAIVFDDPDAARQTIESLRVREVVSRACVYRADGSLLAGYLRNADARCPEYPNDERGWTSVASHATVERNGHVVGTVYVERTLADLSGRVVVTATAGSLMLLLAGALAFGLARRLQRVVSDPIVALAQAAREIGRDERYEMPAISAAPDETGELVHAFGDMVQRLLSSNDALRREVEERRRMQAEREHLLARERQASRLKDEFLAAVSHELRTPLNAILGWTQILTSTRPTEEILTKALASLARNAQAQNRVIEDLLDVSRIITGKLQLTFASTDLRSIVESAVEVIAPVATAKDITLELDIPPGACTVRADYDRLRQVIWNLLSNAVKFTAARGSVHVAIRVTPAVYEIIVADTGIGIAPEFLPHVFERFRQADGSTTREHGGLGLGLAIVKDLTELHGGRVRAESAGPGRGATFTVELPKAAVGAPALLVSPKAAMPSQRLDGIAVLAVDDNPDALDIISSTLIAAGAEVRVATSGAVALEQVLQAPPDVVLCDIGMPQMDGFELLRRLRELDAASGESTPVIAVSAYTSAEYRARSLDAGFQNHVAKPFNAFDLVQAVADALMQAS